MSHTARKASSFGRSIHANDRAARNAAPATVALTIAALASGGVAVFGDDPQIGPQVRVDVNGGVEAANETSIAAAVVNGQTEIVASWNDWRNSTFSEIINVGVAVSNDGGQTWTDFHLRPPVPNQSTVEGDPMTAYDHRTGTLWVGGISFAGNGGLYVARKRPGQNTFDPSVQIGQQFFADKGWMAAGPAPGDPNATRLYIAYNEGVRRSADMGQTWQGPVSMPFGLGFNPRVGPEGQLYVTYWDTGNGVMLIRSFDGGATFGSPIRIATRLDVWSTQDGSRFPGTFRVPSLNALAVDPNDGTLYCVYFDTTNIVNGQRNVDLYFTTSSDEGQTWTTPVVINTDNNPPGDQFFPWLECDNSGRLHLVFHDSRHTVQNDGIVHGMFDAYYAYSDDRGETWSEFRLTPNSFDSENDGLDRGSFAQFLGDYNGLAFAGDLAYPCYLSTQNGDSDTFINIVESESRLSLRPALPIIANQNNTVRVGNATPGALVGFVYAFDMGSTGVPGCPGVNVFLDQPVVFGTATAGANGVATLTQFVPQAASGRDVFLQAAEPSSCSVSNVARFVVQ